MGMTRKRLSLEGAQAGSRPTEPLWMMVGGVSAEVEEVQGPGEMHLGQVLMSHMRLAASRYPYLQEGMVMGQPCVIVLL